MTVKWCFANVLLKFTRSIISDEDGISVKVNECLLNFRVFTV